MDYLILALATWRLSSLIVNEAGPWNLLARLRSWIGIYYDEQSNPHGKNEIARALMCTWCISVWIGLLLTVLYYLIPVTPVLMLPFALSAVAVIVEELINGKG